MQESNPEKEIQICSHCGQVIYTSKDLEKRLGTPLIFLFEQYEQWKKLRAGAENQEKLHKVASNSSISSTESGSHE